METEGRSTDHPVIRRLLTRPGEFSFFQAVRLLQLARPDAVPIGGPGPAAQEAVRIGASSSLAYQAAEVTQVESPEQPGTPYKLTTTLTSLYGTNSPLPAFYSEDMLRYEIDNAGEDDPARVFIDIFNHRILSLLYRAWSKYRWAFTFRGGAFDPTSVAMLSLIGIGDPVLRRVLGVPAQRLLRYAGFLTQEPRNARTLAGVVSDYFDGVPVDTELCVERWVAVVEPDQNRLGVRNSTLSQSLTLGERVRDRSGKYRLEIGLLPDLPSFESFLPIGHHFRPLGALLRLLIPDPLEYDLRLGLRGWAVPMLRLTRGEDAPRLGWTSWLRSDAESPDKRELFPAPPLEEAPPLAEAA